MATTFRLVITNRLTPRHRQLLPVSPSPQDCSLPLHNPHTSCRGPRLTLLTLPLARSRSFRIAASCPQELLPNSQLGFDRFSSFHHYWSKSMGHHLLNNPSLPAFGSLGNADVLRASLIFHSGVPRTASTSQDLSPSQSKRPLFNLRHR